MTSKEEALKTDDPNFRHGLRERLKMRSLSIGSHKWKTVREPSEKELELEKRVSAFRETDFPLAQPYDTSGALTKRLAEIQRMGLKGNFEEALTALDTLEKNAKKLADLGSKRDIQKSKLPIDSTSLSTGKLLAAGSFGEVYIADHDTDEPLVVKIGKGEVGKRDLKVESDTYALIGEHDNIMKCYGLHKVADQDAMVMEMMGGGKLDDAFKDLDKLRNSGKISQSEYWGSMQHLFRGALKGLVHMEKQGFVHNDLKGDNVMFDDKTGESKLVDIGMASRIGEESRLGMEYYAAPEKLNAQKQRLPVSSVTSTISQDMYSVGQMLFGEGEREHTIEDGKTVGKNTPYFTMGNDRSEGLMRIQMQVKLFGNVANYVTKDKDGNYAQALQPVKPGEEGGKAGKYAGDYESEYVKFLNALMHPDEKQRLSPEQALQHPFMSDSLLDEEGAKAVLQKMVESRTETPPDPQEAIQKEQKLRQEVDLILKRLKTFDKEISEARKLDEKIMRDIESHSKALLVTKPGKEVLSTKELASLDGYLIDLKRFEQHFTDDSRMISDLTREFGALVPNSPPEPVKDDDTSEGKKQQKEARKKYEVDCKVLEKLARVSREMTTTHGQVTTTIRAVEELQQTIKDQGNKGAGGKLDPQAPKGTREAAESIRNLIDANFEKLKEFASEHSEIRKEITKTISNCEKANELSSSGGTPFPQDLMRDLDDWIITHSKSSERVKNEWSTVTNDIKRFKELIGATTRQEKGRGSREKAGELAADDRNLLISLSALEMRVNGLLRKYTQDIDHLTNTRQDCVDAMNRRLNTLTLQVRKVTVTSSTVRELGDQLQELESLAGSSFANPKLIKNAQSTLVIMRMRMQNLFTQASKPSDTTEDNAKLLLQFGSPNVPSSKGNSDSFFINGIDGKPEFILKPSDGESRFSDAWPEGGGAPREILMSETSDLLESELGLKVGLPKTSFATIEDPGFANGSKSQSTKRAGALQKTFKIKSGDPPDVKHMFNGARNDKDITEMFESIDPKDVEAVAIFDFLTLNCDRHAENMMVQNPGKTKGQTRLAAIDSGQCLPTPEAFKRGASAMTSLSGYDPTNPEFNPYDNLLMQMPSALQKLSDEAQESLKKLDPDDLVKKMKKQYEELVKLAPEMAGKIEDSSFELVKRSAKLLKAAASELSLRDISSIYASGFESIIDANPEDVDAAIKQAIKDLKEYNALGGDDALRVKRIAVFNPPLSLSERLDLLKKVNVKDAVPSVEHFKTLLKQLANIDRYIADSSDQDKQSAKDFYAFRDSLTANDIKTEFANGVVDFIAYMKQGGDEMIKRLLNGNHKAYTAYAKNESIRNKGSSIQLNPMMEFFRLGGYVKLKELLGESEFNKLNDKAMEHVNLLNELLQKGTRSPATSDTSGTGTGQVTESSGVDPTSRTSSTTDNPSPPPPSSEEDKKRMAIGSVTVSNPTLWFDDKQFGNRYRISDTKPGIAGDWMKLNQFCSVLSLRWLGNPGGSLKFSSLSETEQLEDAETLIGFGGLEAQVSHAAKALGGTKRTKLEREDLNDLKEGTKIWFGSDKHVMAAVIGKDGEAKFYDPDSGNAVTMSLDGLSTELLRGNVFVVAT